MSPLSREGETTGVDCACLREHRLAHVQGTCTRHGCKGCCTSGLPMSLGDELDADVPDDHLGQLDCPESCWSRQLQRVLPSKQVLMFLHSLWKASRLGRLNMARLCAHLSVITTASTPPTPNPIMTMHRHSS